MKYLLVAHVWHVDSYGFHYKEVECDSPEQADKEAAYFASTLSGTCRNSACKAIHLEAGQTTSPRKLTWKERLSGLID